VVGWHLSLGVTRVTVKVSLTGLAAAAARPWVAVGPLRADADHPQCGRAVQVDPIKPTLKAPGTKRLKVKCDESLSNFAFNFNLRRYSVFLYLDRTHVATVSGTRSLWDMGRGLHSSTFQLNLSRF